MTTSILYLPVILRFAGFYGFYAYLCNPTEITKTLNMRSTLYFQSLDFLKFLVKANLINYKKSLLKPPTFAF